VIHLSQKHTCKGCRAYYTDFCGEHCDLGYQCEGLAPLEECYKPEHIGDYLYLMRMRMNEIRADLIKRAESAEKKAGHLESALETERIRLAACSSAALGYFTECSDEYKSASLSDVLELRAKHDKLLKEFEDGPKYEHLEKPYSRRMLEDENKRMREGLEGLLMVATSQRTTIEEQADAITIARAALNKEEECTATCASDDESACLGCLREYGVQE